MTGIDPEPPLDWKFTGLSYSIILIIHNHTSLIRFCWLEQCCWKLQQHLCRRWANMQCWIVVERPMILNWRLWLLFLLLVAKKNMFHLNGDKHQAFRSLVNNLSPTAGAPDGCWWRFSFVKNYLGSRRQNNHFNTYTTRHKCRLKHHLHNVLRYTLKSANIFVFSEICRVEFDIFI